MVHTATDRVLSRRGELAHVKMIFLITELPVSAGVMLTFFFSIVSLKSLLRNTTLRELNLAANSIGDAAILVFGQVLTHNSTLQKLDLSNNSIGSVSFGRS